MITSLVEIYYSGRLNRPLITFQQAGRKWSRAAVLVTALGASLYQTADLGIAPYDYLSLGLRDYTPCPYFGCRIFTDALSALLCWLLGGLVGLGTLICAFCLGPFIQFFDRTFSRRCCNTNRTIEKPRGVKSLNSPPFVRQYDILSNNWGVLLCQKEYQTNDIRRSSREWL